MTDNTWTQRAGMTSDTDTDNLETYAEQAEASKVAAAASETAAAGSASSASASSATATTKAAESASSATQSASSATASAASATQSASSATASAGSAATSGAAQTAAETAKTGAETAQAAAETAKTAAETAETNAATSEAASLVSKNAAATSASTASTEASNSASSATAAEVSNVAAGVAKVAAETAETNAETAQAASETAKTASEAAKVAAETAETNASTSSATATTQAGIATTKAGEAAASATASANSATASEAAKDAALAALDNFDDRYLGAKASDPTVDNDGNPLISGALYFNTTDDVMKVYEGSQWVAAYASLSGALLVANNLSDLASASAGRTNLGLGTAATTASTDYATAAQGALAASATQPGDLATVATSGAYSDLSGTPSPFDPSTLATVATSGAYSDLSGKPTLGTAASTASTDYATAAQGALAASATQPGDLGTAATAAATDFVAVTGDSMTGNLSFGDNDKAIFGAGSDLQIYHDGDNSRITESGTGNLKLQADNFYVLNAAGNATSFESVAGVATLFYSNSPKLATTSSGCDITGTLTSDGLTVDGNVGIGVSDPSTWSLGKALHIGVKENNLWGEADYAFHMNQNAYYNGGWKYTHTDQATRYSQEDGQHIWNYAASGSANAAISWSEAARLDASGNFLVGRTSTSDTVVGGMIRPDGFVQSTRDGNIAADFNRNTSDGDIVRFSKGSSPVGSIGTTSSDLTIDGPSEHTGLRFEATDITPRHNGSASNGVNDLGASYARFKDLHLSGTINKTAGSGTFAIETSGSSSVNLNASGSMKFTVGGSDSHQFVNGSTEAMRIDSSGNLLVGTTAFNPDNAGIGARGSDGLLYSTRSNGAPALFNRLSSDGDIALFRKNGVDVGSIRANGTQIAYSAASEGLLSIGSFNYYRWNTSEFEPVTSNSRDLGSSTYKWKDGHFGSTVNAANFNTTSDATLKTNVETLTGSLDAVKAMRGVSYDWIENGNSEVGVIAQEVEAIVPDVVSTDDQGIKSVKYGNMVAVLIEAIKEQQAQIDELKAKLGD